MSSELESLAWFFAPSKQEVYTSSTRRTLVLLLLPSLSALPWVYAMSCSLQHSKEEARSVEHESCANTVSSDQ